MYDNNHKLTRAGMEQIIREGGTVMYKGNIIGRADQLPSAGELAEGDDKATEAALAGLDDEQARIDRERQKLLAAKGRAAKQAQAAQQQPPAAQQQPAAVKK